VLLKHPVEVDGVLGAVSKGGCPHNVVLPSILILDALGVVFQACPPKCVLGSHQSILPCSNDTFPTIQLLLGEELLLQLNSHCLHRCRTWRRRRPTQTHKR
jgi:hypothetical protein